MVRLVETLAEIEGTPYFKVTVVSGQAGTYELEISKRSRVLKPPPVSKAS